ncbi:MAG TPA: division/cell wall cluster transcriptional repressor MraZ [Symbiobacteriaceae bacterium]|nr:division/cell wall cluster transcriptional repressor MraZ [Symbiobacteriaceae bacterium]
MFMGEFQHSVDAKGRMIIPAKFREGLGERFIVTRGLDNCLFVFPLREWAAMSDRLEQLPMASGAARQFTRLLYSGATECELDPQGRILIPTNLRQYAAIDKEAVVIGVPKRVEIWAREKWEQYSLDGEENFSETAEKLLGF